LIVNAALMQVVINDNLLSLQVRRRWMEARRPSPEKEKGARFVPDALLS
jgi:hypothetical protein